MVLFTEDNKNEYALKVVGGGMRGAEIFVPSNDFIIGRVKQADVMLEDPMISRAHCRISYDGEQWYIQDLDSTNGTWIGGQKVASKVKLPLRTSIRIGTTVLQLRFVNPVEDTKTYREAEISCSIQPESLMSGLEKSTGSAVKNIIGAVYRFQNRISSVLEKEELYEKILHAASELLPAQNIYMLKFDLDAGSFKPHLRYSPSDRSYILAPEDKINETVVEFVREHHEAVLSIVKSKRHTGRELHVMCVPMIGKDQINGMIYLEQDSVKYKYTEDDLRLMTVIARSAGMALEYSNMLEYNLRNERLVATGATAASLSHYIKNILAGLDGSMNLLKMGINEHDQKLSEDSLQILSKNHRRLGNLVLDLLNLASERKPNRELADMRDILKDVHELMAYQLEQEGVNLVFDPKLPDYPVCAEIDIKGIHRTVLNLVNNAEYAILLKKTKKGQKNVGTIRLSTDMEKDRDFLHVTVADDGVGIDDNEQNKIFDLFISSKGSAGTGLGLAVCRKIIDAHGGTIAVRSSKGKGCSITFSVPISVASHETTAIAIKRDEF
jgi:signal transduction histidine kinase